MSKSVAFAILILTSLHACYGQTCSTNLYLSRTEGKCIWGGAGQTASESGVGFSFQQAMAVKAGSRAPGTGLLMYGCALVTAGMEAPAAGTFWATPGSTGVAVTVGVTASSNGIYCPATCQFISVTANMVGTQATAAGVFIGDLPAVAVRVGAVSPSAGFFCAGCSLINAGVSAPSAGKAWTYGHAASIAVTAGMTNTAGSQVVFCPNVAPAASKANNKQLKISMLAVAAMLSIVNIFGCAP